MSFNVFSQTLALMSMPRALRKKTRPELEDIALNLVRRKDLDINGEDKNETPHLDQVFH